MILFSLTSSGSSIQRIRFLDADVRYRYQPKYGAVDSARSIAASLLIYLPTESRNIVGGDSPQPVNMHGRTRSSGEPVAKMVVGAVREVANETLSVDSTR